jgi:hypothetical protein
METDMKDPFDLPCSSPISVLYNAITSDRDGIEIGKYGLETSIETRIIRMFNGGRCRRHEPIEHLERLAAKKFVSKMENFSPL